MPISPSTPGRRGDDDDDAGVELWLEVGARQNALPPQLDAEQRRVVAHRGSPLLVLAGPGTGKTTTLVEAMATRLGGSTLRHGTLADDALKPEQVLGLTFSRSAAADWRDRLISRLGGGVTPSVSTFHSFAFSLVRRYPHLLGLMAAPRLLAGHEEETAVRDVVRALLESSPTHWPSHVRAAAVTHEFARQVRAAVARARSFEKSPMDLRGYADAMNKPQWHVVADVLEQYEFWLESADAFDYASLISTARVLLSKGEVAEQIHHQVRAIFVDEFQDTDAAQVQFLRALVGPQCDLVVVGDPDQSIYAFRGAQVRGILDFADTFGTAKSPVEVIALRNCRRFGQVLRTAAQVEISKVDYAGSAVWADARAAHRNPVCDPMWAGAGAGTGAGAESAPESDVLGMADGAVDVFLAADARSEASVIAERIRALRQSGADYSDIAVLSRTVEHLVPLRRGLIAAGIPVDVRGDHTPIRHEQAVLPLLNALLLIESPHTVSPEVARELLMSPLCGIDPVDLRRIIRHVRTSVATEDAANRPSTAQVLTHLVADEKSLTTITPAIAGPAALAALTSFHRIVGRARAAHDDGGSIEQVLWHLWNGDGDGRSWSSRLRKQALRGAAAGRRADRDIDSVMTLFEMASRAAHTSGKTCEVFVREVRRHSVPISQTDSAMSVSAVAIMTAHRAKGLEWDHVFIAGVQEGVWPNVVSRTGVVTADELDVDGLGSGPTPTELLAEERRLFYVCMTRARRSICVSAIQGADNSRGDERASRFLLALLPESPANIDDASESNAGGDDFAHDRKPLPVLRSRGAARGSMPALVAQLRQVLENPAASARLKSEVANRLHHLRAEVQTSRSFVHPADPQGWWGVLEQTAGPTPIRPEGTLRFSPTAVELLDECALKWFLERQMSAQTLTATSATFGSIIHAVGEFIAASATPLTLPEVQAHIDRIWHQVGYQAPWVGTRQREAMTEAVTRFLEWHNARLAAGASVAGVEFDIRADVSVTDSDGITHEVTVVGRADRLEVIVDAAGAHAHVFDIKSYSKKPTADAVGSNIQLALYAMAVEQESTRAGASYASVDAGLVMVKLADGPRMPKVMTISENAVADFDVRLPLAEAASKIRKETFPAVAGKGCRYCRLKVCCPLYMPQDQTAASDDEEVGDVAD